MFFSRNKFISPGRGGVAEKQAPKVGFSMGDWGTFLNFCGRGRGGCRSPSPGAAVRSGINISFKMIVISFLFWLCVVNHLWVIGRFLENQSRPVKQK